MLTGEIRIGSLFRVHHVTLAISTKEKSAAFVGVRYEVQGPRWSTAAKSHYIGKYPQVNKLRIRSVLNRTSLRSKERRKL